MGAVAAPTRSRIAFLPLVEEAVRAQIVVDADDVRGAGILREIPQSRLGHAGREKGPEPRVVTIDPAAQQIEAEPATLVLRLGLGAQHRRAEGLADILGLHQPRRRRDPPDAAHGQRRAVALVE